MKTYPIALLVILLGLAGGLFAKDPVTDGDILDLTAEVTRIEKPGAVVRVVQIKVGGGYLSYQNEYREILIVDLDKVAVGDVVKQRVFPTKEIKQGLRCYSVSAQKSGQPKKFTDS